MGKSDPTWDDLVGLGCEDHEYAYDIVKAYGGIPPGTDATVAPTDVLIASVNLLTNQSAIIISRFGLDDEHRDNIPFPELANNPDERYKQLATTMVTKWPSGYLNCTYDDVIVYAENEAGTHPALDSWWMFWMDRSGRCGVARILKRYWPTVDMAKFKAAHKAHLIGCYEAWGRNEYGLEVPIIHDIPGQFSNINYP